MEIKISDIKVREQDFAPTLVLLVKIDGDYIQDFLADGDEPIAFGDLFIDALYEALDD